MLVFLLVVSDDMVVLYMVVEGLNKGIFDFLYLEIVIIWLGIVIFKKERKKIII